ncbi:MAG: InlB B-repeat-containing protein, partial [Clostridia bacterium]|nr:InlB B-repeat-containing protein [Clostridia bacterium]
KDNYNAENILQVEFEAKYLQLVFEIPDLTGKFSVNLTYNQNYSANKIRDMFISGYLKFLDENPGAAAAAQNMTPKLDGVFIDDYNTTFTKVQDNVTIQVTLAQKDYVVTFDPQNGIAPTTQNYHYGNYLLEPAKPTNGALLFLGWYWEKPTESGGTEETRWDFEQDVVTDDVTIFAKWLDEFDLESISVSANRNVNALSQISKGDITVTAHLTAEGGFEQDVKLLWGEYSIKYASPDGLLHVSNSNITVEYTVAGVTKTASLEVPVTPVKIDTTGLRFENKSFAYDGLAHTIIIAGQLPLEIANVSYEYFRGATSIGSDGAINIGIYTVVATFEVIDTDYVAEQMRATLTITRNENEVKVKWDNNSLTYNGQEQHPTVHIFDSEDREITSDLEIEFVYTQGDGICAGSQTVEVTIKTNGYKIVDGASKTYMIAKKQLQLPTLEEEIIYTGLEQSIEGILKGYDTAAMNIGGDISSTNVGKYRATITLIDSKNYSWSAGTSTNIDWEIKPLHLTAEWDAFEFLHDNTEHSPRVKGLIGIIESDLNLVDFENDFVYTLPPQINVGSYTTIVN